MYAALVVIQKRGNKYPAPHILNRSKVSLEGAISFDRSLILFLFIYKEKKILYTDFSFMQVDADFPTYKIAVGVYRVFLSYKHKNMQRGTHGYCISAVYISRVPIFFLLYILSLILSLLWSHFFFSTPIVSAFPFLFFFVLFGYSRFLPLAFLFSSSCLGFSSCSVRLFPPFHRFCRPLLLAVPLPSSTYPSSPSIPPFFFFPPTLNPVPLSLPFLRHPVSIFPSLPPALSVPPFLSLIRKLMGLLTPTVQDNSIT